MLQYARATASSEKYSGKWVSIFGAQNAVDGIIREDSKRIFISKEETYPWLQVSTGDEGLYRVLF